MVTRTRLSVVALVAGIVTMVERGVDVDAEVRRFGGALPPLFWFRDPEGNRLMVVEGR